MKATYSSSLVLIIAATLLSLGKGNSIVHDVIYGRPESDDEEESSSQDDVTEDVLKIFGPIGVFLLVIVGYCVYRKGSRCCHSRPTIDVDLATCPFALIPEDEEEHGKDKPAYVRVLCKEHKEEICASNACRVDYSLLNTIRLAPEYCSQSTRNKAKWITRCTSDWVQSLPKQDDGDNSNQESQCLEKAETNLTIVPQDSAKLLGLSNDPTLVVPGFASICFAFRYKPAWRNQALHCQRLAAKAAQMVDEIVKANDPHDEPTVTIGDTETYEV